MIGPLILLFTVALDLAGGVPELWVTATPIGATVMIGVILLVELAHQIRECGGSGSGDAEGLSTAMNTAHRTHRPLRMRLFRR